MLDPVRMIYINIFAISIASAILIAYRFLFPKRKFPYFFAVILLSIPPIISIFRYGTYESGDLSLHAKFAMDFAQNLKEGNLIPQWAKHICLSYGCPNFLYMYPFPYYMISIMHLIGFSLIASIKAYLIFTYVLSGVFMYIFVRNEIDERSGFIAAIFYLYAPYHLIDMHFRVTIAEMASFMLLPLVFYLINKTLNTGMVIFSILLSIGISIMILSHQAIITVGLPLFLMYIFVSYKRLRLKVNLLITLFSIVFGFLITSYYWVPILLERQFIYFNENARVLFPDIASYLFTTWRYGFLFQGPNGELSFLIGYMQIFILLYSAFIFWRYGYGKHTPVYLVFLGSFILIFLFMQSFSSWLWEILPLVNSFQFSYRLMVIVAFLTAVVAGIAIKSIKSHFVIYLIVLLTILYTILNWGNRRVIPEIGDEYLRREFYGGDLVQGDVTTPKWVDFNNLDKYPLMKSGLIVITGKANIRLIENKTTYHSYIVRADQKTLLRENTFYYPNWNVMVNRKKVNIDTSLNNHEGTLVFGVPRGLHLVEVYFTNSTIRGAFLYFSVFSLVLMLIFYSLFPKIKKRARRV